MNLPDKSGWYRCKWNVGTTIVCIVVEEYQLFLTAFVPASPSPERKLFSCYRFEPNAGHWRDDRHYPGLFSDFELVEAFR